MVRPSDVPGEAVNRCASIFVCVSHWSDNYSSFLLLSFFPFLQSVFGACDDPELGMTNIKSVLAIPPLPLLQKPALKGVFPPPPTHTQGKCSTCHVCCESLEWLTSVQKAGTTKTEHGSFVLFFKPHCCWEECVESSHSDLLVTPSNRLSAIDIADGMCFNLSKSGLTGCFVREVTAGTEYPVLCLLLVCITREMSAVCKQHLLKKNPSHRCNLVHNLFFLKCTANYETPVSA